MSDEIQWPREIWMAERDEHDQGVVSAVLSEHATIARWEGDKERDREFHRYVDEDIYDSHAKYMSARLAAKDAEITRLRGVLTFYGSISADPNNSPWNVYSEDFGKRARAVLKGQSDE